MSISNFQEKATKTGCFQIVFFISALVLVLGMFYQGCTGKNADDRRTDNVNEVALKLASAEIRLGQVESAITTGLREMQTNHDVSAESATRTYIGALTKAVGQASLQVLAEKNHIALDDSAMLAAFKAKIEAQIDGLREQIAPTGDDKDFIAKFKEKYKKTPNDAIKENLDQLKKLLGDSKLHDSVVAEQLSDVVQNWYRSKAASSEADVKAGYDNLTFKRINLGKEDKNGPKALGDLKNRETFEAVMNRYSTDAPAPNKKVSENTVQMLRSDINSTEAFAPLRSLKIGEMTAVVKVRNEFTIYKLVASNSTLPKDFEKKKKKYIREQVDRLVYQKLTGDMDAVRKAGPIKWMQPGLAVLWEAGQPMIDPASADPAKAEAMATANFAKAKAIVDKPASPLDERAARMAAYYSINEAYMRATTKDKLRKDMIWALEGILSEVDTVAEHLRLVDLYADDKDAIKAGDALTQALKINGQYDATGQGNFAMILSKAAVLRKSKMLTDEGDKIFKEEQQRWIQAKVEEDKMAAESKKADEADRKRQLDEAKKVGNAPTPTGTKPGTPPPKDPKASDPTPKAQPKKQ